MLVSLAVYRDMRKAAIAVSIVLLVWWMQADDGSIGGWLRQQRFVMPLTYAAVLAGGVWLYRRRAPLTAVTGFANWVAIGAVLPPIVTLAISAPRAAETHAATRAFVAGGVKSKPDIYYLIFDRYGDAETTAAYGAGKHIEEYLASKGFYVARASRSNYMKTVLSLASSLNADYLDDVRSGWR